MKHADFTVIGAGLAGCECALVLARSGFSVNLLEQKPLHRSEAHKSDSLSELVCSNSLRSDEKTSAIGLLKEEMRLLDSPFMRAADACRVPADKALAVDRELFSNEVTRRVASEPLINLERRMVASLRDDSLLASAKLGIIVAAGPLASGGLSDSLARITGAEHCYFYDAIAPIVWTHSLDMNIVFRASRYAQDEASSHGDYLNCPMNREEYEKFYAALLEGKTFASHAGEKEKHFEGCMPIEALAARGPRTMNFGPLKPVGLVDPRTGRRPWAILQLRGENANMETCNLVGCQTKLLQSEQRRIFRLVPGLADAEFARYGSMHRNTFVNAPEVLASDLSLRAMPRVYLAGQITGVEGYVESAACGLWLALALSARAKGKNLPKPPRETALGALLAHLERPAPNFQPSNVNFGLMPELSEKTGKKDRKRLYAARAVSAFEKWRLETGPA